MITQEATWLELEVLVRATWTGPRPLDTRAVLGFEKMGIRCVWFERDAIAMRWLGDWDSPAGVGEAEGRRVAVEGAGQGGVGDGLGGELPAAAEARVGGRVADAERDEAPAAAGHGQQVAHHAPDGRLALLRQDRVAPDRRRLAAAAGLAAALLQLIVPRCLQQVKQINARRRRWRRWLSRDEQWRM